MRPFSLVSFKAVPRAAERDCLTHVDGQVASCRSLFCGEDMGKLRVLAVAAAALVVGTSNAAVAQYYCPPGYTYDAGVCQPTAPVGYGNPVSGAVAGEASGAAQGYAAGGPVGAIVGGALGTAAGTLSGTANMLAPIAPPACPYGYAYYSGGCYPAR